MVIAPTSFLFLSVSFLFDLWSYSGEDVYILGIRMGLSVPMADRPLSRLTSTSSELRNICGAGIEPSVGTVIMPYTTQGLSMRIQHRGYLCEDQTKNLRKDAILTVVLPQYNEYQAHVK